MKTLLDLQSDAEQLRIRELFLTDKVRLVYNHDCCKGIWYSQQYTVQYTDLSLQSSNVHSWLKRRSR